MIAFDEMMKRLRVWCADRAFKDALSGDDAHLLSELRRARGDVAGLARRRESKDAA